MQALLVVLVLCASLASTACRAAAGGSSESPAGTWKLVHLEGIDVTALRRAPELTIGEDGALSGFAGVNRFSGQAEAEDLRRGQLRAGPLIATLMAGEPRAMEAESRFMALLGSPLEWRLSDGELALSRDGEVKARFRPAGAG